MTRPAWEQRARDLDEFFPGDSWARKLVEDGYSDAEIVDLWRQSNERGNWKATERDYLARTAAIRQSVVGTGTKSRPRLIPDWPALYLEIIEDMRRAHDRLEWKNVVSRARDKREALDGVSESTIRAWCAEDGLPHPSKVSRR